MVAKLIFPTISARIFCDRDVRNESENRVVSSGQIPRWVPHGGKGTCLEGVL